jgi:prepilin-type N-terminal cleavage/methylation domain-containing protein
MVRRRSRQGFTLVELMAAFAVLAVGLLGTVSLFYFGIDKMKAGRETSAALRALRNEMEHLRAQPFEALEPGTREAFASGEGDLANLPGAKPAVSIEAYPDRPELRKVTLRLEWTGENGRRVSKSLTTLIADKGTS